MLTIIVPLKNCALELERFVTHLNDRALLNLPNIQFLFKYSQSTDNTKEILDRLRNENSVLICEKEDSSIFDGMNQAIKSCDSEYICFLGVDDRVIDKDALLAIHKQLSDQQCDLVAAPIVTDTEKMIGPVAKSYNVFPFSNHSGGIFYKRSLHAEYGLYSQALSADSKFFRKIANKIKVGHSTQAVCKVNMNGMSKSQKSRREIYLDESIFSLARLDLMRACASFLKLVKAIFV